MIIKKTTTKVNFHRNKNQYAQNTKKNIVFHFHQHKKSLFLYSMFLPFVVIIRLSIILYSEWWHGIDIRKKTREKKYNNMDDDDENNDTILTTKYVFV